MATAVNVINLIEVLSISEHCSIEWIVKVFKTNWNYNSQEFCLCLLLN